MKKWKGAVSLLLAAAMVFGLAGCGGGKSNIDANAESKKYVYRLQDIESDLLTSEVNVNDLYYASGRIYILTTQRYWEEQTGWVMNLISMNEDGSDEQVVEIMNTLQDNPDYQTGGGDPGFGIDPLSSVATEPEPEPTPEPDDTGTDGEPVDGEEPDEPADDDVTVPEDEPSEETPRVYNEAYISRTLLTDNYVYAVVQNDSYSYDSNGNYIQGENTLVMHIYNLQGEKQGEVLLNDDPENYMWIRDMCAGADGNVAVSFEEEIWVYDVSGKLVTKIPFDASQVYVEQILADKDGFLNLICYNNEWTKITAKRYNIKTGAEGEEVELPGSLLNYSIRPGKNWDFLVTNSNGVYGYNIGEEEPTQILSYINSDLDNSSINSIYEMEDGKLFFIYTDEEWNTCMAVGTYVPPEEIPDKEALMLACSYLNWNMRRRIVAFNKESEQYRIVVNDYSAYNTPEDYTAGITKLNNDIISGQIPDILILNSEMPVDSYIAKGFLADIGKMIEEDEELHMEDYMTNVFEAYSVDGKLYSVIPAFSIATVMGKTADVGETPGWTLADLKALMEAHPEASVFGKSTVRSEILWQIMRFAGSRFVDRSSGKCHFDTQEFIDLLEFMAQFPEEFDYESEGDDYWKDYETQYRSGKTLLMNVSFSNFDNYIYWAHGMFGEPVTLIGFPSEEGIGAAVSAEGQYAISARSQNKEGAWEFLRYYLTEEYQKSDDGMYSMPVLREALLANMEEAKERPYWENEDGTKEYYDRTYWIGDEQIIMDPLSDEEADALLAYIESVTVSDYYDESLLNIIQEETEAFFKGDKGAAEVAEIIQSRAQVYINESR